jgi:hypothetical protein
VTASNPKTLVTIKTKYHTYMWYVKKFTFEGGQSLHNISKLIKQHLEFALNIHFLLLNIAGAATGT